MVMFPYVARILGPEKLGKVNFFYSVLNYFLLVSRIGLPIYGVKVIARARGSREELNRAFTELLFIHFIAVSVFLTVYLSVGFALDRLSVEKTLVTVFALVLFLDPFSLNWFYKGIENYRYITLRNIAFQFISLILVILCVKKPDDYIIYATILVVSACGSNILNAMNARKYVSVCVNGLKITRHIKPLFFLFCASLTGAVYRTADNIILGIFTKDIFVGLYSPCKRISRLGVSAIGSLNQVLVPRLNFYLATDQTKYTGLLEKSFDYVYFMSIPICTFLLFYSKEIILILGGAKYVDSVTSLVFIVPSILFTSLATAIGHQIIIAHNKEKIIAMANLAGVTVNILLNLCLVGKLKQIAPSIAISASEGFVAIILCIYAGKVLDVTFIIARSRNYLLAIIPFVILGILKYTLGCSSVGFAIFTIIVGFMLYPAILYAIKDEFFVDISQRFIFSRFRK
jgi:O-antigen/teichoic acid export membrane protein